MQFRSAHVINVANFRFIGIPQNILFSAERIFPNRTLNSHLSLETMKRPISAGNPESGHGSGDDDRDVTMMMKGCQGLVVSLDSGIWGGYFLVCRNNPVTASVIQMVEVLIGCRRS